MVERAAMGEIPIKPATSPDSRQPSGEQSQEEQLNLSYTVLIVGDAAELAPRIRLTLERMKVRVFHETLGSKALEVFHAVHPDLVLLDIALPDMTGWTVLDTIREQQQGGSSPTILVVTAYGDPANRLMGRLHGVQAYLTKPLTADAVEQAVAEALHLPRET
jgi:CheY-like chemotaxis protein